jgi:hypothetical protein
MTTKLHEKIQFKRLLPAYLLELKALTGLDVSSEFLCSVEDTEKIRNESSSVRTADINKFAIDFEEKNSERFKKFITSLNEANSSPIYIWTNRSNFCGLHKINSIGMVDFSFPFDVNQEGIVVFLTEDINDKLLLDFSCNAQGEEILEVESQGKNWSLIPY